MTGPTSNPSLLQRQPVAAAATLQGIVIGVELAFWSVASDYNLFPSLTTNSILLLNAAILGIVLGLSAWWARAHSTPTAAPKIAEGTTVVTTNATTGATTGTVAL